MNVTKTDILILIMNSEPPNSVLLSIYDYSFVSIYIIVLDTKIGHANYEKVPIWAIEIVILVDSSMNSSIYGLVYKLGLFYLFYQIIVFQFQAILPFC